MAVEALCERVLVRIDAAAPALPSGAAGISPKLSDTRDG
jgi:hypothetical protein